jgi:hypothetical protein
LYDSIVAHSSPVLKSVYGYTDVGLVRDRQKVRIAALLHDVGHSPFSHGSEELFPEKPVGETKITDAAKKYGVKKSYKHEDYSVALIRGPLAQAIDSDDWNKRNHGIKAEEIAAIIEGTPGLKGFIERMSLSFSFLRCRLSFRLSPFARTPIARSAFAEMPEASAFRGSMQIARMINRSFSSLPSRLLH